MAIRRNVLTLTPAERGALVAAIRGVKLFATQSGGSNWYDDLVANHAGHDNNTGHGGHNHATVTWHNTSQFLPWHREFLLRYEQALQAVTGDPNFGLPYWDWTADAAVGTASVLWGSDLMGGTGDPVSSGPFVPALWVTSKDNPNGTNGRKLSRGLGIRSSLPAPNQLRASLDRGTFDEFARDVEGTLHNPVHNWVGGPNGQMSSAEVSPDDPVFYLHHCMIDRVWALWQQRHPDEPQYVARPAGNAAVARDALMAPWNQRSAADVLDVSALAFGYAYRTIPAAGGALGIPFEILPPAGVRPNRITVRAGDVVDAIRFDYPRAPGRTAGGPGGGPSVIDLARDERVLELSGTSGYYFGAIHLCALRVRTNLRTYGPFGSGNYVEQPTRFALTADDRTGEYINGAFGYTLPHTDGTLFVGALGAIVDRA